MLQIAEATWESLSDDPEFRNEMAAFDRRREAAARASWVRPCIGLALALAVLVAFRPELERGSIGIFLIVLIILAITWTASRNLVRRVDCELEGRLIEAMARRAGFEFLEDYFDPPGLRKVVEELLFGSLGERRFIGLASAVKGPMKGASTYALVGRPSGRFYKVRRR